VAVVAAATAGGGRGGRGGGLQGGGPHLRRRQRSRSPALPRTGRDTDDGAVVAAAAAAAAAAGELPPRCRRRNAAIAARAQKRLDLLGLRRQNDEEGELQEGELQSGDHIWFKFQVGPVTSLQTRWYVGRLKRKLAGFWWNIHFLEDDDNNNCELNPATRWSRNNRWCLGGLGTQGGERCYRHVVPGRGA
jgi:hypothetical protein